MILRNMLEGVAKGKAHIRKIGNVQEMSRTPRRYKGDDLAKVLGLRSRASFYKEQKNYDLHKPNRDGFTLNEVMEIREIIGTLVNKEPGEKGRSIGIANQKGGVQKTTNGYQIGSKAAELGLNVLMVDFDPQASLTALLGLKKALEIKLENTAGAYILGEKNPAEAYRDEDLIQKTEWDNLDIVGCCHQFMQVEHELYFREREILMDSSLTKESKDLKILEIYQAIRGFLEELKWHYDLIVVDSVPNLGLMQMSIFNAVDALIVPVPCEFLDYCSTVFYVEQVMAFWGQIKKRLGMELDLPEVRFVPVKFVSIKLAITSEMLSVIRDTWGPLCLETKILVHNVVREHHSLGESVFHVDTKGYQNSQGLKKAKENYEELTMEILQDLVIPYIPSMKAKLERLYRR